MTDEDRDRELNAIRAAVLRLMRFGVTHDAQEVYDAAAQAQRSLQRLMNGTETAAEPPSNFPTDARDFSPSLLNSPKSQEFARVLRQAANLACEVDRERGLDPRDGLGEVLSDLAVSAERDAFRA